MEIKEMKEVYVGFLEIQGLSARMQEIKGLVLEMKEMEDISARMTEIKEKLARIEEMNEMSARFLVVKEVSARTLELKGMMKEIICSWMVKNLVNSSSAFEEEDGNVCSLPHVFGCPVPGEFVLDLDVFVPDLGVSGSYLGVRDLDLDVHVLDLNDHVMQKVQVWCIVGLVVNVRGGGSKVPSMPFLGEHHLLVFPSFFVFDGGGLFR